MQPKQAVLATLLVPGAAHVALGHTARGALAFALTVGLFVAGYAIVGTHFWYFALIPGGGWAEPVLRYVPVFMLPEATNLGCTLVAALLRDTTSPDAMRLERMPVAWNELGLLLTAASGMVNCLWMADAHWLAQRRTGSASISPPAAAAISWLLPGAGHWLVGQRDKGLLLGVAVLAVFGTGLLFSGGHAVDRELLSAWYDGQILCGSGVIFGSLVTAPLRYAELPAHHDVGVTLCTVAGFMNLLVMTNAYTVAEDGPQSFVPQGATAR